MAIDRGRILGCDVSQVADPDLATVAVLARMQLVARRLGLKIHLQSCPERLRELLALAGLEDTLPVGSVLDPGGASGPGGVEARREAEQREHALGVQEEADPGDLSV